MWRWLCAQPSRATSRSHPASSAPQPAVSRSSPRSRARFCPQFHSRVTDSTLGGATSCRSTGHTAETREGRAVFIVAFFVSFHPGEGGKTGAFPARSQHERITYLPAWPAPGGFTPHRARRPPRAQPQCSRPGALGTPGLVVSAGGVGVQGLGRLGSREARKGRDEAGALRR